VPRNRITRRLRNHHAKGERCLDLDRLGDRYGETQGNRRRGPKTSLIPLRFELAYIQLPWFLPPCSGAFSPSRLLRETLLFPRSFGNGTPANIPHPLALREPRRRPVDDNVAINCRDHEKSDLAARDSRKIATRSRLNQSSLCLPKRSRSARNVKELKENSREPLPPTLSLSISLFSGQPIDSPLRHGKGSRGGRGRAQRR